MPNINEININKHVHGPHLIFNGLVLCLGHMQEGVKSQTLFVVRTPLSP